MSIRKEGYRVPCCQLMTVGGICPAHGRYGDQVAQAIKSDVDADLELTVVALEACGYRVHLRERAGTRWVTAAKGLQVQYVHWHPLTNINQAMQLLQDRNLNVTVTFYGAEAYGDSIHDPCISVMHSEPSPQDLIAAQCRAIVTACASLKGVR